MGIAGFQQSLCSSSYKGDCQRRKRIRETGSREFFNSRFYSLHRTRFWGSSNFFFFLLLLLLLLLSFFLWN